MLIGKWLRRVVLPAGIAALGLSAAPARADDAFVQAAKAFIAKATNPAIPWTGPTTGPKAQPGKLVVYV